MSTIRNKIRELTYLNFKEQNLILSQLIKKKVNLFTINSFEEAIFSTAVHNNTEDVGITLKDVEIEEKIINFKKALIDTKS